MPAFRKPKPQGAVNPKPKAPRPLPPPDTSQEPLEGISGDILSPIGNDIPPHVWTMLQTAGETAASRLVEILQSPRFASYAPSAQRGLIELALTRAYGLPIRKALNLNLSTSDADAVAMSLSDLSQSLPEHMRQSMRASMRGEGGAE